MPALCTFLLDLLDCGRVTVPPFDPDDGLDDLADPAIDAALRDLDAVRRADAPGTAPPLDLPAARYGAVRLYRACQLLADREASGPQARDAVLRPFAGPQGAAASWSVDLTLRFLPDVYALARGLAADDPLVAALARLAEAWPLSSVGLALDPAPEPTPAIRDHEALAALYVDRAIERRDRPRLAVPWVRARVRAVLGAHPDLAPDLRIPEIDQPE